jgi:hypothetical protein
VGKKNEPEEEVYASEEKHYYYFPSLGKYSL